MTQPAKARKTPCGSCPYRREVASGIWHESEYAKLEGYDGDIIDQSAHAVFMCHQQDGCVCSGWLGHRDPAGLLAVRLGISRGDLAPEVIEYTTTVPLFESGADAAAHGLAELYQPGEAAVRVIEKITRKNELRNSPGQ